MKRSSSKKEVVIIESSKAKIGRPTVVTGFPGPGLVGSSTALHLASSLGMAEIAHIESNLIPPMKLIVGDELRTLNLFRIYLNLKGKDILAIVNEKMDVSSSVFWEISQVLVDWLRKKGTKEIFFLEGAMLGISPKEVKTDIFAYSTDKRRLEEIRRVGVTPLSSDWPMAFSGITATMIEECESNKIPWTILFAPTQSSAGSPNLKAIVALTNTLNKILDLNIDTEPILKMQKSIRRRKGLLQAVKDSFFRR